MKIQLKIKPTEWQGRTVYRAYYLREHVWRRYGKYEAASPGQLVEICERLRGAAELEWTNYTPPAEEPTPYDCARAIEGYYVKTVEVTVTEVNHLGHNAYTADAEVFHDETEETEQRQFLIAVINHRLVVNP
jgi:hypothetical protein